MTGEESTFLTHLYRSAQGEPPRQLTFGTTSQHGAQWSPTGDAIAFLAEHAGHQNLWAMPVTGGAAWPLTA